MSRANVHVRGRDPRARESTSTHRQGCPPIHGATVRQYVGHNRPGSIGKEIGRSRRARPVA